MKKCVLLGVSGGIAAYKACDIASKLTKDGVDVRVIMTENATKLVSPITFEALTNNRVSVDTFEQNTTLHVSHVALAKMADVFLVAPASADVIAKFAHGIGDDMLTTTMLAANCKKLIAPAMNTQMLLNPATQRNLDILREDGFEIINSASGRLACGDVGEGRLADTEAILDAVSDALFTEKDMAGVSLLVSAGPTREDIDPVRYITNHSSGKMGYAIARAAKRRGAKVTLITGHTELSLPFGVETVMINSAEDMYKAVLARAESADIIIKAAAVADYTPITVATEKIKKSDSELNLPLKRTKDILFEIGKAKREGQLICGFSMETENLLENSVKKLKAKNADMIVANSISEEGAGFNADTNRAVLITSAGEDKRPFMTKDALAHVILDELMKMKNR